jgi:hypothetical protein
VRRLAAVVAIFLTTGCGATPSTASPPATGAPPGSTQNSRLSAPPGPSSAGSTGSTLASPIPVEPGLLDLLPGTIDGVDRQTDASVDAGIAGDPDLAAIAKSFATALYVASTSGEFAYVSLVRLRQPLGTEAYRDYRESFDQAACSQAGGRTGTATGNFGGRSFEIGRCAGGLLTYHLALDDPIIVSISSLGERRLGEKIAGSLANPGPS